jgi:hypothetical protein
MPTDLQLAVGYLIGTAGDSCHADAGQSPVSFFDALWKFLGPDILIDLICVVCLAPLSWAIELGLRAGWNSFAYQNLDRPITPANSKLRYSISKGILLGISEAALLGVPAAMLVGFTANFSLPGDACANATIDTPYVFIKAFGVIAAFLAACAAAACISFPTKEETPPAETDILGRKIELSNSRVRSLPFFLAGAIVAFALPWPLYRLMNFPDLWALPTGSLIVVQTFFCIQLAFFEMGFLYLLRRVNESIASGFLFFWVPGAVVCIYLFIHNISRMGLG